MLLIHGDDDRNVPFSETVDLLQRLRAQKVQVEEMIFPDEIHDFLLWRNWIRAYTATQTFSARNSEALSTYTSGRAAREAITDRAMPDRQLLNQPMPDQPRPGSFTACLHRLDARSGLHTSCFKPTATTHG